MRYLLVILFLFPALCFAEPFGYVESGYDFDNQNFYAEIEAGYEWDWLWLWGNVQTLMEYHSGRYDFGPFSAKYGLGGEITWRGLYVQIEHYCVHPVFHGAPLIMIYDDITTVGIGYRWGERR